MQGCQILTTPFKVPQLLIIVTSFEGCTNDLIKSLFITLMFELFIIADEL